MRQLASFWIADVEGHGLLAFVQPRPIEAGPIIRHRPAVVIQTPANGIDPDDFGAHLRQGQTRIGGGDESRYLDHGHAC